MRANALKRKLLSGEPAYGLSIMIPSPQIVEMAGLLGFDWVLLDCEHGTLTPETVEMLAMAATASGLTPIARPRVATPEAILEVMDRGVMGVQAPHVNTADDARRVVGAVKFAPLGERGLATGTRAADYGLGATMREYVEAANRETLVCVQAEEAEALRNLGGIARVEGVDVIFLGPSDLSQSLGYPGQPDAPAVQEAVAAAFRGIVASGKVAGCVGNAQAVRRYRDLGARYLYTHVPTLLAGAARSFFAEVKGEE